MPKKTRRTGLQIVSTIDLPHKKVEGWRWTQEVNGEKEFSKMRLADYAETLLDLGMAEEDIQLMFSNLYWDSFCECMGNKAFENELKTSDLDS